MIKKFNFLIACNEAIIAQETKNLYILGTFDRITSDSFPIVHSFAIVVNAEGDVNPDGYALKIEILDSSDGKIVTELDGKLPITKEGNKSQFIGRFSNIEFKKSGKYIIRATVPGNSPDISVESTFRVE